MLKRNASTLKRNFSQRKSTALGSDGAAGKSEVRLSPTKEVSVTRPGTVQSVRGERRIEAMRKMGVGRGAGSAKVGKSMRVVEE